jgi:uncharacterized protein YcbX
MPDVGELLGTVLALWRYPVKSMMGEAVNASYVGAGGLAGDRAYALVEPETGRIGTAKIPRKWGALFKCRARYLEEPGADGVPPAQIQLPDGAFTSTDAPDIDEVMSALLGRRVRMIGERREKLLLESPPLGLVPESEDAPTIDFPVINGFFDLGSIHLISTATLDSLRAAAPGSRFEARRFRPNIIASTPEAEGFPEEAWTGRVIAIGEDVRVKVTMPTLRCVVTTLAQDDLPDDPGVLRTAAAVNKANVGIYGLVERPGYIRVGDPITFA